MRSLAATALLAAILIACSAQPTSNTTSPAAASSDAPVAAAQPPIYGRWRIAEVNGAPARTLSGEGGNVPSVSFGPDSYGGSSGCNRFGGTGLQVGERWFAEPPMATQQGCAELDAQESTIFRTLSGGPRIEIADRDAVLRSPSGTLRLQRIEGLPDESAGRSEELLAGTRWELYLLNGKPLEPGSGGKPILLTFEADRWTLETPCVTTGGPWRQLRRAVVLEAGESSQRPCSPALAERSAELGGLLDSRLHYAIGPNDELVLASDRQWAVGRGDRSLGRVGRREFSGLWRVVSVDGVAPPQGERPAEVGIGPGAFSVWDGCRHSEGVAIPALRQLFTHGSGVVTLANCPADPIRQKINAVVGASPRIARTADDGIALVSGAGTLRLQRTSARPFGAGVETRLRAGTEFRLLTGESGPVRLALGPSNRFTVSMPCGSFEGRWRMERSPAGEYVRFGPERPALSCGEDRTAMRLYGFFSGDVFAAIGPNRDIALFVSRGDSLPARLEGP